MNKYGMSLIIPFSRTMMLTCPFLASDSFLSSSGSHNSLFLYITAAKASQKKNKKENIPGTDNEKPHPALSSTSVVVKTTISFASPPDKAFI